MITFGTFYYSWNKKDNRLWQVRFLNPAEELAELNEEIWLEEQSQEIASWDTSVDKYRGQGVGVGRAVMFPQAGNSNAWP